MLEFVSIVLLRASVWHVSGQYYYRPFAVFIIKLPAVTSDNEIAPLNEKNRTIWYRPTSCSLAVIEVQANHAIITFNFQHRALFRRHWLPGPV